MKTDKHKETDTVVEGNRHNSPLVAAFKCAELISVNTIMHIQTKDNQRLIFLANK